MEDQIEAAGKARRVLVKYGLKKDGWEPWEERALALLKREGFAGGTKDRPWVSWHENRFRKGRTVDALLECGWGAFVREPFPEPCEKKFAEVRERRISEPGLPGELARAVLDSAAEVWRRGFEEGARRGRQEEG